MKRGLQVPPQGVNDTEQNADSMADDNGLDHGAPHQEGMGGLFPEGMDPQLLASLQTPTDGVEGAEENTLSIENLMDLCRERVCPVCPIQKETEDAKLRALADLENTKKRLLREKEEQTAYVSEKILQDIIPALDNLSLALQHAPQGDESKNFVIGVEMTRKLLLENLQKHGLEEVGHIGEAFDPVVHEAVGVSNIPEIPDDHVAVLLSKGYRLNGRLLRPAKVMVSKHSA